MTTVVAMDESAPTSPRLLARIAGLLYLINISAGIFAQAFVSDKLVASADAASTAANILAHRSFFELGFTVYLVEMACQVAVTVLFYELLKPAGRTISLLAACLSLVGIAIKTFSRLFYLSPLLVLGGAAYLGVFSKQQLEALALLLLTVNDRGAAVGLVFFGFYATLKGYLIVRSTFLPRILGVLSVLAGLGLLTFLHLPLGYRLFPYIAAVGLLAAVPQILWLLVVGVDEQRWKERAGAQRVRE